VKPVEQLTDRELVAEFVTAAKKHRLTQATAGEAAGVSQKTASEWWREHYRELQPETRLALETAVRRARAGEPLMASPDRSDGAADFEGEWRDAVRDIRLSGAPPQQKAMALDALASVIGRVAWARGELAAIERARAVSLGDEAGRARAEAFTQQPTTEPAPVSKVRDTGAGKKERGVVPSSRDGA
jgi:DNA-binding XRE family transcriptional regulator